MPIVNRDYLKLVLLYVHIVEILTTALEYPNHAGPKSKIVSPCSAQTSWIVLHRVRCGGSSPTHSGGLDAPARVVQICWPYACSTDNAHIFFYDDLKTRKVGQIDMVLGFWSGLGFISRSVHARWQVCVPHWLTSIRQTSKRMSSCLVWYKLRARLKKWFAWKVQISSTLLA